MKRSAQFSVCGTFRYSLERVWNNADPKVLFIGLNPSSADEIRDDPTIRKCTGFAKSWGYGGFYIVNLFAFCSHSTIDLLKAQDPIGPKNDAFIKRYVSEINATVLIWGNYGHYLRRNEMVLKLIKYPLCLKINKNGSPSHPLYLNANLKPIPYPV